MSVNGILHGVTPTLKSTRNDQQVGAVEQLRFQVLMMSMKMAVFWDVALCSLVDTD
jgi:hypothetical protein